MSEKIRNRIVKGILYLFTTYILLFFLIAPMRGVVTGWQSHIGMNIVGYIQIYAYWSWINQLDEENIVRELWSANQLYWCIQSDYCSVKT